MKRSLGCVFGVWLMLSSAAWGAKKPSKEELDAVTARGVLLAEYDQAAWHATDAVRTLNATGEGVRRWIGRKTATGWVVDFGQLNAEQSKFVVAYEAVQTDAPEHFKVNTFVPGREDADFDLFAGRAIELALRDFDSNAPMVQYNVAVLPAESGRLYVYVYPAQVKVGVYPYGGDARYLVSGDGRTIIEKRQMHKAVLESIPGKTPSGSSAVGGFHSDILGDLPEDTDVFLVMARHPRMPEYVGAGGHVFVIAIDGGIEIAK